MITILALLLAATPFAAPSAEPTPTTEPAPTEPAPTEPAPTEPAPPEPAPTEPAPEPAPPDPAPTDPLAEPDGDADAPATELAEVEAEHEVDHDADANAESFDLQPPAPEPRFGTDRRRSLVWGQVWLSLSILAGRNTVGLGGSVVRFVVPRLGFGLDLEDMIVLDRGVYNLFQLTPKAVFLLLPTRRVTPIASAGFGGAFFSRQLGAYGRWVAGAGLMIAIREHLRLGFGLDVEGLVPKSRFYRKFECGDTGAQRCHIGLSPWISFGFRA